MWKRLLQEEDGVSAVLAACAMVGVLGMGAIVLDGGHLFLQKSRLNAAADAAALAGAAELMHGQVAAHNAVWDYAGENGLAGPEYSIQIDEGNKTVTVSAERTVPLGLGKVLGESESIVAASSTAKLGTVGAIRGVVPLAVEKQSFVFGWLYTLKEGGGDGSSGNYGCMALGLTGSDSYEENLTEGYEGQLRIGDEVTTEPGNMSGATMDGIADRINSCPHVPTCTYDTVKASCPRLVTVIVVDHLDVDGRNTTHIAGFAAFYLEGIGGQGVDSEIYGRFVKLVKSGEVTSDDSTSDFGLYAVKLVR